MRRMDGPCAFMSLSLLEKPPPSACVPRGAAECGGYAGVSV